MINNIKNQRGITLITLIITIVLLIIITTTIAINSHTSLELSNLTKLENDIQALNDRVAAYYVANGTLPVTEETYTKAELEDIITGISINDGDTYYTIDLSKLSNITLNYGKRYNDVESQDKYIINEESHNIYYLNGVKYQGKKYYTISATNEVALVDHVAEYNESRITITFDANGGTIPTNKKWTGSGKTATKLANIGSTYGELPMPTRDGYTFLGWSNLPSEYQEIEYIESTGTQYIDTNFIPTLDTKMEIKLNSQYIEESAIFGSDWNLNGSFLMFYRNVIRWHSSTAVDVPVSLNTDYVIETGNGYLKVNGSDYNCSPSTSISQKSLMLYYTTGQNNIKGRFKTYYWKIYDNDVLIRNYIPCYRKNDNVIGLYDTIEGKFYTNSGTGMFNKGKNGNSNLNYITEDSYEISNDNHTLYAIWGHNPIVTFNPNGGMLNTSSKIVNYNSIYGELPTPTRDGYNFLGWKSRINDYFIPIEYQEVEYIGSTGTQYIDTNFIPTLNTKMEIKLNSQYIGESAIFGSDWSLNGSFLMFYRNAIRWHSATAVDVPASLNTDYVIETGNGYLKVNDTDYNCTPSTSISPKSLTLYYTTGSSNPKGSFKTYYWKIFDNNVLVRNYIPCYRKKDNVVGLYDNINDKFYVNLGEGIFDKGNNVNDSATATTQVITNEDHTLYAIWQKNE